METEPSVFDYGDSRILKPKAAKGGGGYEPLGIWKTVYYSRSDCQKIEKADCISPCYGIEFRNGPMACLVRSRASNFKPKVDAPPIRLFDVVALCHWPDDKALFDSLDSCPDVDSLSPSDYMALREAKARLSRVTPGPWRIYQPCEGGYRVVSPDSYLFDFIDTKFSMDPRDSTTPIEGPVLAAMNHLWDAVWGINDLRDKIKEEARWSKI